MYEYLDRRYALALYEIAEEKNKVPEFLKELREIVQLIYGNEEIKNIIRHPQISSAKKKKIIIGIFEGKIDKDILSFLIVLVSKNRILALKEKLNAMEKIYLEKHGEVEVNVTTAIPLSGEQKELLINKIEKKYNKKVILTESIDKKILGGVYVRVGNDVIDNTLKRKLYDMKNSVLKGE